ncbi:hypothetical protein PUNSTDRAFT_132111 [Punctularia strigosozonata HHB-11173 SS5]|uniref:uncharacterized protein n=1 Tax=Punctularia strigosozonata (strain HHB-11173) TaxID=741275 RepID=UPI0004416F26|nr:uncharacterized protein PUNSTDRAFT_132111 [Punctularia strigosozonata HHB-11173 SS5]EIN11971.1 hypothetical protein PUNSTDRAFT_132111 [Punctularia strigosozonata HHB-11173 SS5]
MAARAQKGEGEGRWWLGAQLSSSLPVGTAPWRIAGTVAAHISTPIGPQPAHKAAHRPVLVADDGMRRSPGAGANLDLNLIRIFRKDLISFVFPAFSPVIGLPYPSFPAYCLGLLLSLVRAAKYTADGVLGRTRGRFSVPTNDDVKDHSNTVMLAFQRLLDAVILKLLPAPIRALLLPDTASLLWTGPNHAGQTRRSAQD